MLYIWPTSDTTFLGILKNPKWRCKCRGVSISQFNSKFDVKWSIYVIYVIRILERYWLQFSISLIISDKITRNNLSCARKTPVFDYASHTTFVGMENCFAKFFHRNYLMEIYFIFGKNIAIATKNWSFMKKYWVCKILIAMATLFFRSWNWSTWWLE